MIEASFPNADLRVFYGAAETGFVAMSDPDTPPGSVGRPYPGVDIHIEAGEVFVRSPVQWAEQPAFPKEDTLRGHQLVLVVEGRADTTLAREVRSAIRAECGALATPAKVLVCANFPMLPPGKINLSALNKLLDHSRLPHASGA